MCTTLISLPYGAVLVALVYMLCTGESAAKRPHRIKEQPAAVTMWTITVNFTVDITGNVSDQNHWHCKVYSSSRQLARLAIQLVK